MRMLEDRRIDVGDGRGMRESWDEVGEANSPIVDVPFCDSGDDGAFGDVTGARVPDVGVVTDPERRDDELVLRSRPERTIFESEI